MILRFIFKQIKLIFGFLHEDLFRNRRTRYLRNCQFSHRGVANGTLKKIGLGKFWQHLKILKVFFISPKVSFLQGLFLLLLSVETFYQRVLGSDFQLGSLRLSKSQFYHSPPLHRDHCCTMHSHLYM